jgi:hypothetical protein
VLYDTEHNINWLPKPCNFKFNSFRKRTQVSDEYSCEKSPYIIYRWRALLFFFKMLYFIQTLQKFIKYMPMINPTITVVHEPQYMESTSLKNKLLFKENHRAAP